MRRVFRDFLIPVFAVLILFPAICTAQDSDPESKWEFSLRPLLYVPNVSGDVVLNSDTAQLVSKVGGGGILSFQASKGKWNILSDLMFVSFSTDVTAPITNREGTYDATATLWGIYATYKVNNWLELGLGDRVTIVASNLYLEESPLFNESDRDFNLYLFPPLVVYRFNFLDTPKWRLKLLGDVGGFGFFNTFTYLVNPYLGYNISDTIGLELAYRLLFIDHTDEEGNDDLELTFSGPQVGVSINF